MFVPANSGWTLDQCEIANTAYATLNTERPDLIRRNAEMIVDAMSNLIGLGYWPTGVIGTGADLVALARMDATYGQAQFLWSKTRKTA